MPRHAPQIRNERGASRDEVAMELIVLERKVRNAERKDEVPAQQFLDKGTNVHEIGAVTILRKAVGADDRFQLCLGPFLDFGI